MATFVWVGIHRAMSFYSRVYPYLRQKTWLSDGEVVDYTAMVKGFARAWGDLGWKVGTRVHWTCAHSSFFMKEYKNLYIFSSIPNERKNSPFKGDVKNSMKGWVLTKPAMSRFSMGHVLNITNLDMGLLGSLMEQQEEVAQRKKVLRGRHGARLLE